MGFQIENTKNRVTLISIILLVGMLTAIIFHYYASTFFAQIPYYHTFFFSKVDQFGDFGSILTLSQDPSPYLKEGWACYFPLAFIIGFLFTLVDVNTSLFIFLMLIVIYSYILLFINIPVKNNVEKVLYSTILCFCSFPVLFCLDRGNFEGLVFIFLSLAIFSFNKKMLICNLFLSLSISMKLFPALFLLLYIKEKKYTDVLIVIGLVAVVTLASLMFFEGTIFDNISALLSILDNYHNHLALDAVNVGYHDFGSSIFGAIKIVLMKYGVTNLKKVSQCYFYLVIIMTIALSYYVIFFEKCHWKNIAIITYAINCFPYISADYKLIHILIPLLFYLKSSKNNHNCEITYCLLFGLLLIPKNYGFGLHAGYAGNVIDPILMIIFSFLVIYESVFIANDYEKTNCESRSITSYDS